MKHILFSSFYFLIAFITLNNLYIINVSATNVIHQSGSDLLLSSQTPATLSELANEEEEYDDYFSSQNTSQYMEVYDELSSQRLLQINNDTDSINNQIFRIHLISTISNSILLRNIQNNTIIDITTKYDLKDPSSLTLMAKAANGTASVVFDINENINYSLQNGKPYLLCGHVRKQFTYCPILIIGENKLIVKPYSGSDETGVLGESYILYFTIRTNNDITPNPTAPPIKTDSPTALAPTEAPTEQPIPSPTDPPESAPTDPPVQVPTDPPTDPPVIAPTDPPVPSPTDSPVTAPTDPPVTAPTDIPVRAPTDSPVTAPTDAPISAPTIAPTDSPISAPTIAPTDAPVSAPTTEAPILIPTASPSQSPVQPPTSTMPEILINCGYDQIFIDSLNRNWLPDQYYINGITYSSLSLIADTNDDFIYQYERTGLTFSYAIPLTLGNYEINFLFAELIYTNIGDRIFNIVIENSIIIENIDIIDIAKAINKAISINRVVNVIDGILNIDFIKIGNSIGDPKISGIEIRLNAPHLAHAVAAGPYQGTILIDTANTALVKLNAETTHTHEIGSEIETVEWKEGNVVLGNTIKLDYQFTAGIHDISLSTKDTGNNVDTDRTTVDIKPFGYPAIISLSPDKGSTAGNYDVTIVGSGFNYAPAQLSVTFGTVTLTGSAITVISATTLKIKAPPTALAVPTPVSVTTPLGTSNEYEFSYIGSTPIQWQEILFLNYTKPTVGRFGPDQNLYVGTRQGYMLKITMNADFTATTNVLIVDIVPDHAILGLAFDPTDTKAIPDVYFSVSLLFHGGTLSTSGNTINGRIMRASGPSLETKTTVVSGLPVADLDHALNAMVFGDYGELYFNSGSHTNGGIPGKVSKSQLLKENFLSAGVNVAYLSHPNFNGNVQWSADDEGDLIAQGVSPFAMGLRNPYGLLMHSNGKLYATDNGPNFGYGKMMTGCGANQFIDDQKRDDEFVHVQKDHYYGHPNPQRAAYLNEPRQCVYHGPEEVVSTADYTAPLASASSSRDGIVEFHSDHFGGQLRGNVIVAWNSKIPSLSRIILNADGSDVVPESKNFLPLKIGNSALDVTQAPNGNLIEMRFQTSGLAAQVPVEIFTTAMSVKTVFPRRGPNAGGNVLSIYGINFGTNPTITVGGSNCPFISSSSTSKRIDCTLPGGVGTVDIVVTIGAETSKFFKGYRYISGLPPPGFVLPVYPSST